jgi:hypothetical protein
MFSTAAENIGLYWQVSLALGSLMAILFIAGFSGTAREEPKPGTSARFANIRLHRLR